MGEKPPNELGCRPANPFITLWQRRLGVPTVIRLRQAGSDPSENLLKANTNQLATQFASPPPQECDALGPTNLNGRAATQIARTSSNDAKGK